MKNWKPTSYEKMIGRSLKVTVTNHSGTSQWYWNITQGRIDDNEVFHSFTSISGQGVFGSPEGAAEAAIAWVKENLSVMDDEV